MSLPESIRQSIRNAIIQCGNSLYTQNPDPYVNPVEDKIMRIVDGYLTQARKDAYIVDCYQKKINDPVVLTVDNKKIITTIFENILGLKCQFSLQASNPGPMELDCIHRDIFTQDLKKYVLTLVWEPKNPVIYGYKSLRDLLNNQEVFRYSVEAHLEVLHQDALKGGADIVFIFSDAKVIPAHRFMLLAYASQKLIEDARDSHFRYPFEIYEMIVKFIYTGKVPVLSKNNLTSLAVLKEASQYYEIQPLLKWSSLEFEKNIKESIDPEKDFLGYFQLACDYKKEDMLKKCFRMAENSAARLKELLSKLTLENYDYVSEVVGVDTPVTMKGILSQRRHLVSSETSAKTKDVSAEVPAPMCKPFSTTEVGTFM